MTEYPTPTAGDQSRTELWLSRITIALIATTVFMIPFGNVSQVTAGLIAFTGVGYLIRSRGKLLTSRNSRRYTFMILCHAIPVAISLVGAAALESPAKALLMALLSYLGSVAVFQVCRSEQVRNRLILFFAITVGIWVLDTLFQAVVGRDILGFAPYLGNRYGGPFTDQYMLGAYLGFMSALLLFYGLQRKWPLLTNLVVFALVSVVVLLSNTRTGWVMYAIVSAAFIYHVVFRSIKHRFIVLLCLLLAGTISVLGLYKMSPAFAQRVEHTKPLFSGDPDAIEDAISGRLIIWHTSVNVIKGNPINGVGAGNVREVFVEYKPDREYGRYTGDLAVNWAAHPHQLILETGVGTGFIGLAGLLMLWALLWKTWREGNPVQRAHALPWAVLLLAAFFPINSHAAHYGSKYALILWMFIALYVAYLSPDDA